MNLHPLTAIIVAGGKGMRMQSDTPKQFIEINALPILMHTIHVFVQYNPLIQLIIVLPSEQIAKWSELRKKHAFTVQHSIIAGGDTRFESVKNGLSLAPKTGLIAIHDGVRPFVSLDTIDRCFKAALQTGTAVPVTIPVESIRQIRDNQHFSVDRSQFRMVQTPQVFQAKIIHSAYSQSYNSLFTDDASIVEQLGIPITLVEGNPENIKITNPCDLKWATSQL